jgi:hypothetical protein
MRCEITTPHRPSEEGMRIIAYGVSALAVASAFVATGLPAQAQSVGWLETIGGSIEPSASWPSYSYTLTSPATGQYQVTFPGLGNGLNSDVQVNAVSSYLSSPLAHYCTAVNWGSSNGTDVMINIDCFDASGNPLNSDFSVFYQARTTAPTAGTIAYLWANQPTTTTTYTPSSTYSYNSSGGVNTVTRDNTGLYFAYLPGITTDGGNPQVTAYGGVAARCEVVDWYHNHSGTNVAVQCVNSAGNPADEYFDISFAYGVSQADGPNSSLGIYAWANNSTATTYTPLKSYQFNNLSSPAKTLKASNGGGGVGISYMYTKFPKDLNVTSTLEMVTAEGSLGEYCDGAGAAYSGPTPADQTLYLNFNAQGQQQATEYTQATLLGQN